MLRALVQLARADVLERIRRGSFLVVLGAVLWLGIGAFDGTVQVRLGEYVGRMNSAWAGGMMALVATAFLSLAGFWVVKNAVVRDESTGVGQILAATPLTRLAYVLGKWASHFLVLTAMVGVLVACGIALALLKGGGDFDPVVFLAPFALVTLPALAVTAAFAILFETTPILRGGAGNVIWFFAWGIGLALLMEAGDPRLDILGFGVIGDSMRAAAAAAFPDYRDGFSLTLNPGERFTPKGTFAWPGVQWSADLVASRFGWLLFAVLLASLAAVPFHRFDPARNGRWPRRRREPGRRERAGLAPPWRGAGALQRGLRLSRWIPGGLVGSEFRLLVAGAHPAWWAVVAGFWVAAWVVPLPTARGAILPALWLLPVVRWSGLGSLAQRHDTEPLILSAPGAWWRQPVAAWAAGTLLTALIGLPVALRLATVGDAPGLFAWLGGASFIPALALALGSWSGVGRLFEAFYTLLWYVGPLNRTPPLDFMGSTLGTGPGGAPPAVPGTTANPLLWCGLAVLCIAASLLAHARRLRS